MRSARTTGSSWKSSMAMPARKGACRVARVGAGQRAPAHGVEEGVQAPWLVERLGVEAGQRSLLDDARARLEFPDHPGLLARPVVVNAGEGDEVLGPVRTGAQRVGRQRAAADVGDDPRAVTHAHELARLGSRGRRHARARRATPRREEILASASFSCEQLGQVIRAGRPPGAELTELRTIRGSWELCVRSC